MRKLLLALALVVFTAAFANAAACSTFLGADVTTISSCTVGTLTFSNFQVSLAGGSGTPLINLSGVYEPSAGPVPPAGFFGLNFNPNMGGAGNPTDLHFIFTVTGYTNSTFLGNAGSGSSQIQERVCSVFVGLDGLCPGNQVGSDMVASSNQTVTMSYAGLKKIYVWKDINITSVNDHISSFSQAFNVPEPVSLALMGGGLVALGLLRRRVRR